MVHHSASGKSEFQLLPMSGANGRDQNTQTWEPLVPWWLGSASEMEEELGVEGWSSGSRGAGGGWTPSHTQSECDLDPDHQMEIRIENKEEEAP